MVFKSKYNKRFINEPDKHIKIRAFKPCDYDISIDTENLNRVYISILPTKEQIKHIKYMLKKIYVFNLPYFPPNLALLHRGESL